MIPKDYVGTGWRVVADGVKQINVLGNGHDDTAALATYGYLEGVAEGLVTCNFRRTHLFVTEGEAVAEAIRWGRQNLDTLELSYQGDKHKQESTILALRFRQQALNHLSLGNT